jgi:hypothetical protein
MQGQYSTSERASQAISTAQVWGRAQLRIRPRLPHGGHWPAPSLRHACGAQRAKRPCPDECAAYPVRPHCTQSKVQPRRLQVRDQAHYAVLQAARERQKTALFQAQYTARAGIEGAISQGMQLGDLRRSRYRGLAKTRLLHLLIATALNFIRVTAWLAETPRARTRQSAFRRLAPAFGEQQPAERGFASGILTNWAIIRVCAGADRWLPDPNGASRFPRYGRRRSVDRLARPACGRGQL